MFRQVGRQFLTIVLACLLPLSLAHAAERKGGGTVTYVPVSSKQNTLPNGHTVIRTGLSGVVLADDQENPFHLASQTCGGTTIVTPDNPRPTSAGYCNTIDKDGDAWCIWWRAEGQGSVWEFVEGTGKYKGIKGSGTTKTLARFPDGRQVLRWQGVWHLK